MERTETFEEMSARIKAEIRQEEIEEGIIAAELDDPIRPARGIVVGIALSAFVWVPILWSLF